MQKIKTCLSVFGRGAYRYVAAAEDPAYFSVGVCFGAFPINDLYGFACWKKMEQRQGVQK